MDMLHGARKLINLTRTMILVEVENKNMIAFRGWVYRTGYFVLQTFKLYRSNINYLIGQQK